MYTREKPPCRDEHHYKSRKSQKDIPSFSSTLLDEIYRSFDGENADDLKKPFKMQSISSRAKSSVEDEETASFRRARLLKKWMEKKEASETLLAKTSSPFLPEFENKKSFQDSDVLFFSSTSSSSDSSGALSSSDTEFFGPTTTKPPKVSCFSAKRPKPVRTSARSDPREECDYTNIHQKNKEEDEFIKSRSRALKIYANLKKVKQPISPGTRLTSFINSLFSNNAKKSKSSLDLKSPKAASTTSACSSASSFSRSCLSKYSPRSREKMRSSNGTQRTVRFHPVSVIVDEDSRPCGQKCIYGDVQDRGVDSKCERRKPPLPPNAFAELKPSKSASKVEEAARNVLKGCYNRRVGDDFSVFRKGGDDDYEDEDEFDGMSDSSSDLFELDHLSFFANNRFQEELPVYETTNLDINRAIASSLIR